MISCRRARELLVENVRQNVAEVSLLQLDQHLATCVECRLERARWETVGSLRDWQAPTLGNAARDRILKKLVEARPQPVETRRAPARPLFAFAGLALAGACAFLIFHRPKLDAEVKIQPGAVATVSPEKRTIAIQSGEVDVNGHEAIAIRTPKYIVKLVQAHAVFAAESIRVYSGEVFVYSLGEVQLATLEAGQSWPPAAPVKLPTAPIAPAAPVVIAAAPQAIPAMAAPAKPAITVEVALEHARAALAEGNAVEARHWIDRVRENKLSQHDRAESELFVAESYLVEKASARAVAQYRKVAESFSHLPEGEAASFAAAQVLSESGSDEESRAALQAYLARYPEGRFAREARDRLRE
jgi:hypothetical protein